jgi:serine/threonine protein kinase
MAQEAFIQHVALIVVEQAGFLGAIPKVYDVYRYGDECRFTMDYIDGRSSLDELYRATDPGTTFIQILAQVCFILLTLESKLHLDHRDMKMTNLWIRKKPVSYIFTDSCTGLAWHTAAPFQVVLLDFGFACLGSTEGHALLNLGDGVFPDLDPCPKEGRDLFQCIVSLWSVDAVRDRLPADIQEEVAGWLTTYADLAKRFTGSSWSYAVTSDPKFRFSNLHPAAVLMRLARRWPAYVSFNG